MEFLDYIFLLHSFNQPYSFTLSLSLSFDTFYHTQPKNRTTQKIETILHNPTQPYTFRKSYTIPKPYTFSIKLYTYAFRTHFLIFFPPSLSKTKKMEQFEDPTQPYTFRKSYTIRKPYTFSIELYTHAFRTHFLIFPRQVSKIWNNSRILQWYPYTEPRIRQA